MPHKCPECGSPYIKFFGVGTEQVVEEVKRQFPEAAVLRMDYDTTRKKDAHAKILEAFRPVSYTHLAAFPRIPAFAAPRKNFDFFTPECGARRANVL